MNPMPGLPAVARPVEPCKCCGKNSSILGVVDFHRNVSIAARATLQPSGVPVYYHRCGACGLIFTAAFDHFTNSDFAEHIYNDGYGAVDQDYLNVRPDSNVKLVSNMFQNHPHLKICDYGGGNGRLAAGLQKAGFAHACGFDPFVPGQDQRPEGKFDVVTSFEVIEHANWPQKTLDDMLSLLAPGGLLLFSTLVQPPDIDQQKLEWWYVMPRNGHVTLFSQFALTHLATQRGLMFGSWSPNLHAMFRPPVGEFAAHLFKK